MQVELLIPIAAESEPQVAPTMDESLLIRLRERDVEAFDWLITNYSPQIRRLVSRLLGWQHDCDDVFQEVFVAAWERIEQFRGEAQLDSWLYSIALNQCRKVRRNKGAWRRVFGKLCETHEPEISQAFISADVNNSPQIQQVQQAIKQLSQKERELIVLCCLETTPLEQAAKLLGIRKNTLEVRLHRARKKLKRILVAIQETDHE